jgi:hypothetical protein
MNTYVGVEVHSIYSQPRESVEVSGQFYDSAALFQGKEAPVPIG